MCSVAIRKSPEKLGVAMGLVIALVMSTIIAVFGGTAFASPSITISPGTPYLDGQTVTVSGTGFPVRSQLPQGLEIIECSDPGGTFANLPSSAAVGCDGTTVSGEQINTDADGSFTASYPMDLLNLSNSSIKCDAIDYCVLWVGIDYNNQFLVTHAFSSPFEINPISAGNPQTLSFTSQPPTDATIDGLGYNVSATSTSGLPVTLSVDASSTSVCYISDSFVSFNAGGVCVIDADQGGDGTYAPASQVQQSILVHLISQVVSFTSTPPMGATVGGPSYGPSTVGGDSFNPVVITVDESSASVCVLSEGLVSFIGKGVCTLDANQAGNAQYLAASQVQQGFPVSVGQVRVTTVSLTNGVAHTRYAAVLSAIGGDSPYRWSVVAGALPLGLHLKKTTGAISGMPKRPGTYTFTVKLVDHKTKRTKGHPSAQNTATKVLSIMIL